MESGKGGLIGKARRLDCSFLWSAAVSGFGNPSYGIRMSCVGIWKSLLQHQNVMRRDREIPPTASEYRLRDLRVSRFLFRFRQANINRFHYPVIVRFKLHGSIHVLRVNLVQLAIMISNLEIGKLEAVCR